MLRQMRSFEINYMRSMNSYQVSLGCRNSVAFIEATNITRDRKMRMWI